MTVGGNRGLYLVAYLGKAESRDYGISKSVECGDQVGIRHFLVVLGYELNTNFILKFGVKNKLRFFKAFTQEIIYIRDQVAVFLEILLFLIGIKLLAPKVHYISLCKKELDFKKKQQKAQFGGSLRFSTFLREI